MTRPAGTWPAAELAVGAGWLSLSPLPGRGGDLAGDLTALARWRPDLLISLTEPPEMPEGLAAALATHGIGWRHLPLPDYGIPAPGQADALLAEAAARLAAGGRIALHCMGGCGRSGMLALRLMLRLGEATDPALARLRAARPCAIETEGQLDWALSRQ